MVSELLYHLGLCLRIPSGIIRTETFCTTRIGHNTRGSSCYDVEFGLSFYHLVAVWITDSEDMASLSTACCEDITSPNSERTSEKPVSSETFSFFEFTEHDKKIMIIKEILSVSIKVRKLYKKIQESQKKLCFHVFFPYFL